MANATGYSDDVIAQRVRLAVQKVVSGKAAYEQDSVLFHTPTPPERVIRVLRLALRHTKKPMTVLDFGGSLGSLYFRVKPFLSRDAVSSWIVCEQPNFVRIGHEFEDSVLKFVIDSGEVENADVLVLSSVLPYLEDPICILKQLVQQRPRWILIDRTPLSPDGQWHLFDQHVPRAIYRATYPVWLIPRTEITQVLPDYDLTEEAELDDEALHCGNVIAPYRWMIWHYRDYT